MNQPFGASPQATTGKGAQLLVITIVVAAFTPYLGVRLNIRWEHLIVYSVFAMLLLGFLAGRPLNLNAQSIRLLSAWLTLGLLTVVNTTFRSRTGQSTVDPLAITDSFLLPTAIFLIGLTVAQSRDVDTRALLQVATASIVVMLALNSTVILIFDVDVIEETLHNFWSNPATRGPRGAVADRALKGDRYGGIFNQPFDGGVAYTTGVISWIYLVRSSHSAKPIKLAIMLTGLALLIAGGISTQSKVFPYASILVVALAILSSVGSLSRLGSTLRALALAVTTLLFAGWLGLIEGFDRTLQYVFSFRDDPDVRYSGIYGVTGGRTESVGEYLSRFQGAMSFTGRGWSGPQDDAFISYINGGGLIGLLLFIAFVATLMQIVLAQPAGSPEKALAWCLMTFMTLASFGAVSFQVNRASSIFWLLASLLTAHARVVTKRQPSNEICTSRQSEVAGSATA